MRRLARGLVLGCLAWVAACDQGPSGPGTLTATVVSPDGPEGAAVVMLTGDGLGAVSAAGATRVFSNRNGTQTHIVLVNLTPGELRFSVEVPDLGAPPPAATVFQVVDKDNVQRTVVSGYRVTFSH